MVTPPTTASCPEDSLAFAERLADAAGAVIRPYFRAACPVEQKPDRTPVTAADRAAERAMRRLIAETYPDHGILGEEYGGERTDAAFVWVLDPIDGTKSFITGVPLFGTLIALLHHRRPILGIIDQPVLGERWVGAAGRPTLFNGAPVRTRPCGDLQAAVLSTTGLDQYRGADAGAFARLAGAVGLLRHITDCYGYAMLASGHVDLVVEAGLQPYDHLALTPVVAGAGGVITDWRGRALDLDSDGRVAAAGDAARHAEVLALLAAAGRGGSGGR